jgi:hypothetical protein
MPLDCHCPKCQQVFPIVEARHAVGVQCPGCETELTAEFRPVPPPLAPGQPPYELLVSVGRPPGAPPRTPGPTRTLRRTDDAEPPRVAGSLTVVILAGIGALLITLGGLGATGYYLFTHLDPTRSRGPTRTDITSKAPLSGATIPGTGPASGKLAIPGMPKPGGGNTPPHPPRKPSDTFELRPVMGTLPPITPPALDANTPKTILLPGSADAVAVGGGGRYIVLHFPQGRLAVFDANSGDVAHEANAPRGRVLLAAGANMVVLSVSTEPSKYRVYSLPELRQQSEFECPLFHGAQALAMGSRTNGPLLMTDPFGHVVLVDLLTGQPVEGSDDERLGIPSGQLRASADGKLFVAGTSYTSTDSFVLLDETARKWRKRSLGISAACPAADGKAIFGQNQILDAAGHRLAGTGTTQADAVWYVPAVTATGEYYLKVSPLQVGQWPREKKGVAIAVHAGLSKVDQPLLTPWEFLPETENFFSVFNEPIPFDQHLFLIPEAKLLVILNQAKTRLVVRRLVI